MGQVKINFFKFFLRFFKFFKFFLGKLDIDEMVIMFNTNNIHVTKQELKDLFFKNGEKLSDDDLFLDFYQFMEFALNKVCDQDFRIFMRKLKKKKNDNLEKNLITKMNKKTNNNIIKIKNLTESDNKKLK